MEGLGHGSDVLQDQQLLSMFMDIEPGPASMSGQQAPHLLEHHQSVPRVSPAQC